MKNKILEIYTVSDYYIEYLWQIDNNVMLNHKQGKISRPYVGVVLDFDQFLYFVPLTHNGYKWKNYSDHIVLDEGRLGAIKIGKMIPIPKSHQNQLVKIVVRSNFTKSLNSATRKYGYLLFNQYREINTQTIRLSIIQRALYFYTSQTKANEYLKFCCNYKLLEKYALLWTYKYLSILYVINSYYSN